MNQEKILHLTLNKKWFDMIYSGEKKEEYREIKFYWIKRIVSDIFKDTDDFLKWIEHPPINVTFQHVINNYSHIVARNGYAKDAPTIKWEHLGIEVKEGKSEWGAEPNKKYFVLKIGEVEIL